MRSGGGFPAVALATLLLVVSAGAGAVPAAREQGRGEVPGMVDVVYAMVGNRALRVDIHRNLATLPSPVFVHVHGGGWARGVRPPRERFAAAMAMGFSVVAVEYRLAAEARAPAAVQDVRCAIAWVGSHATAFGFDVSRIVVEGSSAGAHLALLAVLADGEQGLDAGCGPLPPVAALVDRSGIVDLQAWHPPSGAVERWIGARDDLEEQKARLSPLHHVRRDMPPLFIAHGDADAVVPIAQSRRLHAAVAALGVPVAFHVVPQGGHGDFTAEQETALAHALCRFLRDNDVLPRDGRPARSPDPCKGGDP